MDHIKVRLEGLGTFHIICNLLSVQGKTPTNQGIQNDRVALGNIQSTVPRFYSTAEYRSAYFHQFRDMVSLIRGDIHYA